MKRFFSFLFFLIAFSSFSGGLKWPNVEYDHAKLYYFNILLDKPSDADFHIYHDSIYATSKLGNGVELKEDFLQKIHEKIARYSDPMRMGLSKCYFPRHGIIYYDKLGNPVASASFCFECDRISLWSSKSIRDIRPNSKHDWSHIEKEFIALLRIFKENKIQVFKQTETYENFVNSDSSFQMQGEITIENNQLDSLYKKYSIEDIRSWNKNEYKLELTEEAKFTAGGDKWTYKQLNSPTRNSRFVFSFDEDNPYLIEATIRNPGLILPNGVSVGMALSEVMNTIGIYDGPAYPEHITLKSKKLQLDYYFEKFTLVQIKATISNI